MTTRAAIGLGANLGDRERTLRSAGHAIGRRIGSVVASSSLWETAPIGGPEQGPYLNAVVVVDTELAARGVLEHLLDIERDHGRERGHRWGPRTLDLDLLLFGDEVMEEPDLSVPHPRLTQRRFVLEPLLEVWPDAALPDGTPLATALPSVQDQQVARRTGPGVDPAASIALFLAVGLLAAGIWWLMGLALPW